MSENGSHFIAEQIAAVDAALDELHADAQEWLRETRVVRRQLFLQRMFDTLLEWLAAGAMCVAGFYVLEWALRPADPLSAYSPVDPLERTTALFSGLAGMAAPLCLAVVRLAGLLGWRWENDEQRGCSG